MNLLAVVQKGTKAVRSVATCHRFRTCFRLATLLLSPAALSGCATPCLWHHTAARNWCPEPLPPQFLAVVTNGQHDVIAVFRQSAVVGKKTNYRGVAWNLRLPGSELITSRKTLRQLTNARDRVQLMPSFPQDNVPAEATSASPGYVVHDSLRHQFTVHLDGFPPGPYELPRSDEKTRSLTRIGLLPFSVIADAVIIVAIACASGGGPGSMSL